MSRDSETPPAGQGGGGSKCSDQQGSDRFESMSVDALPDIAGSQWVTRQLGGQRARILVPDIPDNAPDDIREGFARRAIVMTGGRCPCGATMPLPNREARRANRKAGRPAVINVQAEHETDCPAIDRTLTAALARWRR